MQPNHESLLVASLEEANALQQRRIRELEGQIVGLNRLIKRLLSKPKPNKLSEYYQPMKTTLILTIVLTSLAWLPTHPRSGAKTARWWPRPRPSLAFIVPPRR
jgi:hypothetical protein